MSLHEYKGCAIRVVVTDGRRPYSVEVDGARLMGKGERVQRQLAYSTSAAALRAGQKHIRTRMKQCEHVGHLRAVTTERCLRCGTVKS